jgi:hypothetical protein
MKLFDQMRQDLLTQKSQIESRGRLNGGLELNLGTFVVKKGDKYYSNGSYSFETPDEFDKRTAEATAFQTGGVVFKAEVYWGKKYQTICQALSSL